MACCNMCVMLLSIKREFVRKMKKDMEILEIWQQNEGSFRFMGDERGINPPLTV